LYIDQGMKLTIYLHLMLRLRMHGAKSPFSHVLMLWCLINHRDINFIYELLLT
jgi:hypothetical protein